MLKFNLFAVFVTLLFIYMVPLKLTMQLLITKNYDARQCGLLPDKMYWIDYIYFKIYGDYNFYNIEDKRCPSEQ